MQKNQTSKENEATVRQHHKDFSPIQLIGRKKFDALAKRYGTDVGVRTLSTSQMVNALLEAKLMQLDSFREIEGVLSIARSTLSDAMESRCGGFFMDLADEILRVIRGQTTTSKLKRAIREILAIDSSEIDVHGSLFDRQGWAKKRGTGRRASCKLHVVWNVDKEWVEDFSITGARKHDAPAARRLRLLANKIYVFDRAYLDLKFWTQIAKAGSSFVTRLKSTPFTKWFDANVLDDKSQTGVLYEGPYEPSEQIAKQHSDFLDTTPLRHVVYRDPLTKKLFHFVSSDTDLNAQQVADVYKRRWAVELLFRWLKGHVNIRRLPTKNSNAAEVQLAIAVIFLLLLRLKSIREKFEGTLWKLLCQMRIQLLKQARCQSAEAGDISRKTATVLKVKQGTS